MEVSHQTSANWVRNTEKYDVQKELIIGVPWGLRFSETLSSSVPRPGSCQGKQNPVFTTKAKIKDLSLLRSAGCSFALDYPSRVVTLPGKVSMYRFWVFVYRF